LLQGQKEKLAKLFGLKDVGLIEYIHYCCTGEIPKVWREFIAEGGFLADLVRFAYSIGALEPVCAIRPGVCDPEIVIDRDITVPVATIGAGGAVTPSEEKVISICAPMNRALVVRELKVTPANLTASTQPKTQPVYKRVNLAGFGEWCLPFEPHESPGLFANVQNIITPPKAGFSVFVQNHSTTSEAVYHVHGRMWACC
jgi:hypothetical protein